MWPAAFRTPVALQCSHTSVPSVRNARLSDSTLSAAPRHRGWKISKTRANSSGCRYVATGVPVIFSGLVRNSPAILGFTSMTFMSGPTRAMPSGACARISLSSRLRRSTWASARWLFRRSPCESRCERTWLATNRSPMPPASAVSKRSRFWSVIAWRNTTIAPAVTATHGNASCHNWIEPSAFSASWRPAGHSGARAISR